MLDQGCLLRAHHLASLSGHRVSLAMCCAVARSGAIAVAKRCRRSLLTVELCGLYAPSGQSGSCSLVRALVKEGLRSNGQHESRQQAAVLKRDV